MTDAITKLMIRATVRGFLSDAAVIIAGACVVALGCGIIAAAIAIGWQAGAQFWAWL